jgi:transcriptional regulator with XRE-family HTH domain
MLPETALEPIGEISPLAKIVIDNIKRIRKERGVTQEKLAEVCETSTSYIGLMEIYKNTPKLSTIERIAEALEVDVLELFKKYNATTKEQEKALQRQKSRILRLFEKELDKILRT